MQKFLVLIASVLVVLLGLEAVTEAVALPLSGIPDDENFTELDLIDDVNDYVKRMGDNDFAARRGKQISQIARNRALYQHRKNVLDFAGKRGGMDKRNLSQNDLSQGRSNYINQLLAYQKWSQLMGTAGRR